MLKHTACRAQSASSLPRRVIDAGNEETPPFLHQSRGECEAYVALSYCWGTNGNVLTTQSNLQSHISGLVLESLPKTIRDAIVVTRSLNIRYLWVDALCIIQDLPEDFDREVVQMADIYASASLTIAVKEAVGCAEGCLKARTWSSTAVLPLDLRIPTKIGPHGPSFIPSKANRMIAIPQVSATCTHSFHSLRPPVLETRGWTLQEEILSSLVLNCWCLGFQWTCLEGSQSETHPRQPNTAHYQGTD